jgi:RNA-binding protein YhbY
MSKKGIAVVVLALCSLVLLTLEAQAATITACTFDKEVYYQGDVGVLSVTIYNDREDKIRVIELTSAIDYFYSDGNVYLQTFYTNATLPHEIQVGQSSTLYIHFTLPSNVASGYTRLFVRARTEIWSISSSRWMSSDTGIYEPVQFIESPYKEQYEQEQALNQQLQEQLTEHEDAIQQLQQQLDQQESINVQLSQQFDELQAAYSTNTMIMVVLGVLTFSLVAVIVFLMVMARKSRALHQPAG